ncbi:MAG: 16S rRNA (cytosine(1402)-N(4))-methyltransferase RsmH [Candidatus Gastranaerophilales bacterium]|nr:16S rRNA (cytosine(1402)-N(4))-methyltransferase RsmH [Candidatus Gastranaerophilales bacterium]
MQEFNHYTVMKNEAVDALECRDGLVYVDCTLGGGGHSELILQRISPNGKLFAFDIDDDAINYASERLKQYDNLTIIKNSYVNIKSALKAQGIDKITGGVLLDLGASYHQLTKQERGFSFSKEAPLDMRFDMSADFSAYDVINSYKEDELVQIFSEYGEERFSKRIAKAIVNQRVKAPIKTTTELAELIVASTPRIKTSIHPATRVFQAVRIEVNNELKNVKNVLNDVLDLLDYGAIISVISFHSLEDRIVKRLFKYEAQKCRCNEMICKCEPPRIELVNKKPITASEEEIKNNPPSRSAKLRIVRCIKQK